MEWWIRRCFCCSQASLDYYTNTCLTQLQWALHYWDITSRHGIGAVLTQNGRPIAYMSRALGVVKQSWSVYTNEMLAIVIAIQIWRPSLIKCKFFIKTYQCSLKNILEQRIATLEQQKWVSKLFGYDYKIIYKPGKENMVVDALFRQVHNLTLDALFMSHNHIRENIKK